MRKVLFLVVAFTLMFQAVAFAEGKIGVVSLQAVLVNCDYGKASAAKLKAKFEPMMNDLKKEAEAIKKLESELKNQDLALKLEAKQDKQREYRRKVRDFQDSQAAYQQKLQADTQQEQQPVVQKIAKVVNDYGKANGYSVILERSSGLVYVKDGIDLSDQIVDELNKLKKAGK